jgi:orotate phosphoribosyltransferase
VVILQKDGRIFGPDLRGHRVVVVDDVVQMGARMRSAATQVEEEGGIVVGFACIIDRSKGTFDGGSDKNAEKRPLWSAFQTDME